LIAQAEGFAIDKETVLAGVVFDGEVVALGEELLSHQVDHSGYNPRNSNRNTLSVAPATHTHRS
jgi:hypothetical protein